MKAISRIALYAILVASMCVVPALAQEKPAPQPSPTSIVVDADKPDTPEFKAAEKLGRQVGPLLAEYTKNKKPSEALKKKVWDLRGKTVVVEGGLVSSGDPIIMAGGDVDYIFHFDLSVPRMQGMGVFGKCAGVISYVDPVKKIVVLDHATVRWLGAD